MNTWLSDVYIIDLGDNAKRETSLDLNIRVEFYLESSDKSKSDYEFKSTNKRLIIPIFRKNNYQYFERYMVTNSNALALFLATVSLFGSFFDISGNFIKWYDIFDNLLDFTIGAIGIVLFLFVLLIPFFIWGRIGKNKKERVEKLSDWKEFFND